MAKSAVSKMAVIGTTYGENAGVATSSPSTADSTLIAGVIMPSPNSNPAPNISDQSTTRRPSFLKRCSRP